MYMGSLPDDKLYSQTSYHTSLLQEVLQDRYFIRLYMYAYVNIYVCINLYLHIYIYLKFLLTVSFPLFVFCYCPTCWIYLTEAVPWETC